MEHKEIFVGLDVGTSKVAAVVGRKDLHGQLEVVAASSVPSLGVVGGKIAKMDKTVSAIKAVIGNCEKQMRERSTGRSEVQLRVAHVNISGQRIIQSLQRRGSHHP